MIETKNGEVRTRAGKASRSKDMERIAARLSANSNGHCPDSPCGAHWWMIEPVNGPVSLGRCRYCGAERRFANTIERAFGELEV